MANKLYEENSIRDIAVAIREKNGTANTYNVAEMAQAIRGIQTEAGGITPSGTIQITENGTHDVTQYASAVVNVSTSGGGSSDLPSGTQVGVITVDENKTDSITITHGLGATPRVVTFMPVNMIEDKSTVGGVYIDGYYNGISCTGTDGTKLFSTSVNVIQNITETTFDFVPRSASYPLIGGHSYLWVAMV